MIERQNKRLRWVVLTQFAWLCLALSLILDGLLNSKTLNINLVFIIVGVIVGVLLGLALYYPLRKPLETAKLRVIFPLWIGMFLVPFLLCGVVFWIKAELPMDWRLILIIAGLSTIIGSFIGGLVSWKFSKIIAAFDPSIRTSNTIQILYKEQQVLQTSYPDASFEVKEIKNKHEFVCIIGVPRLAQIVVFYIVCKEGYPSIRPESVSIELALSKNQSKEIPYDPPILFRWRSENNLRDIIREALQILNL